MCQKAQRKMFFIMSHDPQHIIISSLKNLLGLNLTFSWPFSPHKVTSGTQRSWATTASSSMRSRWPPGTAARREPSTASLSALTSSPSANLAGKVGRHHNSMSACVQRFQAGLPVECFYIQWRRCNYLCASVQACLFSKVCAQWWGWLCAFCAHRNTHVIIWITSLCVFLLTSECVVLAVVCILHYSPFVLIILSGFLLSLCLPF